MKHPFRWHILIITAAFLVVLCLPLGYGYTGSASSFYGQGNPFNITSTQNANLTYYLQFPRYGYVTDSKIISLDSSCRQDNVSNNLTCNNGNSSYIMRLDTTWAGSSNEYPIFDGNYSNGTFASGAADYNWIWIKYMKPQFHSGAVWQVVDSDGYHNLTLPQSCYNAYPNYVNVTLISGLSGSMVGYYCTNTSKQNYELYSDLTGVKTIYEESITWTANPHNLTIYISNEHNSFHNDTLIKNYSISLNTTKLNSILEDGCACQNCSVSSTYCNIPIRFFYNSNGNHTINLTNTTYAYGIDNCSNSFGIPSNATAYRINFMDTNKLPVGVNLSSRVDYGPYQNNSHIMNVNPLSNYSYCVYPSWANISADLSVQYIYTSILYNYYDLDTYFNNITQYQNLTVESTSTSVTATVYDELANTLEDAYIFPQKYDTTTGNYIPMGSFKTNFEGQAKMPLVLNTVEYKFYIYYPSGTLAETTSKTYIYGTSISFYVDTGTDVMEDYYKTQKIYSNLSFLNSTEQFSYSFLDVEEDVTQGCLEISLVKATGITAYNSSCVAGNSGTIILGMANKANTTYLAKSFVYINGEKIPMDSLSYQFPSNVPDIMGFMGLLIAFILTLTFAFILFFSIPLAVIMIPLPTVMLSSIGMVDINPLLAWGIELGALVLAVIINKRS